MRSRETVRWLAGRRAAPLWICVAALTLAGTLLRAGEGTWVWRADVGAAGIVAGVPMEWEWIDVAQSAWFFEGNPRWLDREWGLMMGQNLIRFVPGAAVSLAGVWTGGAWSGALVLTWLCWLAACAAMHRLYLEHAGVEARSGAAVATLLTAASPGFSAFAGNIDAHQFGYAAAPLALLALQRWVAFGGLAIFLANATLELATPLLAMLWLYHVPVRIRQERSAMRHVLVHAAQTTVVFATLQAAWWGLAHVATLGRVVSYNQGLSLLVEKVIGSGLDTAPADLARRTGLAVVDSFGVVAIVAAVIGFAFLRRSARWWGALWIALILAGAIATRGHARIIYLAFPAVYVAAAGGIDGVGRLMRGRLGNRSVSAAAAHGAVAAVAVLFALRLSYGDLLGDLALVRAWWR